MPDDMENAPEDRRWRPAETLQELFDHMDEFWRSPRGRQLQADQHAAQSDLHAWLADQSGVVVGRHGGQVANHHIDPDHNYWPNKQKTPGKSRGNP